MLLTTVTKAYRASSVFLRLLPTDLILNSRNFHNVAAKAAIKLLFFFLLIVKPFFTSCSCVVSRRVRRWEVHFFWGPAVAPAVLQVFALLRVAGGLRLLPRPRPDSVHGLQQRRLTTPSHIRKRLHLAPQTPHAADGSRQTFDASRPLHMNTATLLTHSVKLMLSSVFTGRN